MRPTSQGSHVYKSPPKLGVNAKRCFDSFDRPAQVSHGLEFDVCHEDAVYALRRIAPVTPLTFKVFGIAQPKGSSRAFVPKGWKRAIVTSANPKLKDWEGNVRAAAQLYADTHFIDGPVALELVFYLPKPKSAPKKRTHCTTRPDCSKLIRSTEDALIGVLFTDDAAVVSIVASKHYAPEGSPACALITVRPAAAPEPMPGELFSPHAEIVVEGL